MIFIYLHKLVSSRPTEYDAELVVDPPPSQSKGAGGSFGSLIVRQIFPCEAKWNVSAQTRRGHKQRGGD